MAAVMAWSRISPTVLALRHIVGSAQFHRLNGDSLIGNTGEHHDGARQISALIPDRDQKLQTGHVRHHEIQQKAVRIYLTAERQTFSAVLRLGDFVLPAGRVLQRKPVKLPVRRIILNHQQFYAISLHQGPLENALCQSLNYYVWTGWISHYV